MMSDRPIQLCLLIVAFASACLHGDEGSDAKSYEARDSLAIKKDESSDAQQCLDGLKWQASSFSVNCNSGKDEAYDKLVRFPTAVPSGDKTNDLVAMEWYAAKDDSGMWVDAPAMLVVHESGSSMPVGRLFARSFQSKGYHAFLIHLPHYGKRRPGTKRPKVEKLVTAIHQACADVRRGYDAIAVLPHVQKGAIGVQGTSLGGFVVATAASLDGCFCSVFITLAGGDLYDVINSGQKDAARVREMLAEAGYTDDKLKQLVRRIEPLRVAHRLNPQTTWIYSAQQDTVVPLRNAESLAKQIGLMDDHHVKVLGNHYTAIAFFPKILQHMVDAVKASATIHD